MFEKHLIKIINSGLISIKDLEQYNKKGYYFPIENGKIKQIAKER